MADQLDALLAPVIRDLLLVEVGRRLCETELVAMAEPIAVPALVPTLDEHAAEAVLRREVDILLRPLGRRAMLGAFGPAPVAADHAPPDADIFHRLEPIGRAHV